MNDPKPHSPKPDAIRKARRAVGLTQPEAAHVVLASLRGWQQWEAGDRAMPPGLFELFMLKTGQWPLDGAAKNRLVLHQAQQRPGPLRNSAKRPT